MSGSGKFADYATSTAFHVSLSRPMAMALWAIDLEERRALAVPKGDDGVRRRLSDDDTRPHDHIMEAHRQREVWARNYVSCSKSLEHRGLVTFHDPTATEPKWCGDPSHRLTEAGRLVLQLCVLAMIVPPIEMVSTSEQDNAPPRRGRRKTG